MSNTTKNNTVSKAVSYQRAILLPAITAFWLLSALAIAVTA